LYKIAKRFYNLIAYRFFAILIDLEKNKIYPKEMILEIKVLYLQRKCLCLFRNSEKLF